MTYICGGQAGGPVTWDDVQQKPNAFPADTHGHAQAEVTGLVSALGGKAATTHAHAQADITGLVTALAGKSDVGHTHPSGGADSWTVVKLANDFGTTSTTAQNVAGLAFTPAANTDYLIVAYLLTRTATATVGPRPGLNGPTGATDLAYTVTQPSSATALLFRNEGALGQITAVGGLPVTTQSFLAKVEGIVRCGASPNGDVRVILASETNGTAVTIRAGSVLLYRTL